MHPNLAEVFALLDQSQSALRAAVERVPAARCAEKPAPDRWSVNEILEHLALADGYFAETVSAGIAKARAEGLGPERAAREPLADAVRTRLTDRSEKREAPPTMMPTGQLDGRAAWAAFEQARQRFRDALQAADGLALGSVVAEHRRFGPLTAYQWAEVVAGHAGRHVAQIEEMARERA